MNTAVLKPSGDNLHIVLAANTISVTKLMSNYVEEIWTILGV